MNVIYNLNRPHSIKANYNLIFPHSIKAQLNSLIRPHSIKANIITSLDLTQYSSYHQFRLVPTQNEWSKQLCYTV